MLDSFKLLAAIDRTAGWFRGMTSCVLRPASVALEAAPPSPRTIVTGAVWVRRCSRALATYNILPRQPKSMLDPCFLSPDGSTPCTHWGLMPDQHSCRSRCRPYNLLGPTITYSRSCEKQLVDLQHTQNSSERSLRCLKRSQWQ